jgi:hypothetical protein
MTTMQVLSVLHHDDWASDPYLLLNEYVLVYIYMCGGGVHIQSDAKFARKLSIV